MRAFYLMLSLMSFSVFSGNAVDLEKVMKQMGFQYQQVFKMQNTADMLPILDDLIKQTALSREAQFPKDKAQVFKQGLDLVLEELTLAKAAAENNNVQLVKQHLTKVDELRKEYHKKRKVSFWQLLFG